MNGEAAALKTGAEAVVLVHGLWMTGLELTLLGRRLRRCGFKPIRFRYPSLARSVADNAACLAGFVAELRRHKVHLVGHSLGGLLILRALSDHADLPGGRVVLLGTPVAGSGVARRLAGTAAGRLMLGRSLHRGLDGDGGGIPEGRQVGVIAGTAGLGIGRVLGGLAPPSDGTVAVAETSLPGALRCTVATTHTGLVLSREAARQVCTFLCTGRFAAAESPAGGRGG